MCAIAGILHHGALSEADAEARAGRMADCMVHRGPDGRGVWAGPDVALGFRRLAIVDIEGGAQPMASRDGRTVVVFNGEIYNHRSLRAELEAAGHVFSSDHSDTEVLVHGWRHWGPGVCSRLNGMFAFAVWDSTARSLFLARDRLGIKPLYIAQAPGGPLLFASEVRGLHASGLLAREADAAGVVEYLSFMNQWGGRTPFRGVTMLEPGSWRLETPTGSRHDNYWRLSTPRRRRGTGRDFAAEARDILARVIRRQADADVGVGAYLSGGIDSSAVAVLLDRVRPGARTYSCIFDLEGVGADAYVDERAFSRAVAEERGLARVEHVIPQDALVATLDHTIEALEYPRMGMAYVNDLIAGRVARDLKVVLSGLGGDELTGGYVGRYAIVPRRFSAGGALKAAARRLLGCPGPAAETLADPLALYRQALNVPLAEADLDHAFTPEFLRAAGDFRPRHEIERQIAAAPADDPWDTVMLVDAATYLHGLLVLEDKLSMAHSLETRVPLLDNEWIDFLVDLPWSALSDGKTGKIVFREAVRPLVPEAVHRKPKMGFAPPDASWYRGCLRSFIEEELSASRVARRGVFQAGFVADRLEAHFSGRQNNVALIWCLLSLESWCRRTGSLGGRI